jgi:hypothetical protein
MPDKPRRIQRSRAKGWRMPEGAVYVGRPTIWGNPWELKRMPSGEWWCEVDGPRGRLGPFKTKMAAATAAVIAYRHILARVVAGVVEPGFTQADWATIRGKHLACWCRLDQPCHADVLLDFANRPIRASHA